MIKVSVMYPHVEGSRFDHDYYRDRHLPLVADRMAGHLHHYTIDRGLSAGDPSQPPAFVGMCHLYCESVDAFQAGFGPHSDEILGDIPNYTDLAPVMQISEVVVG